MIKQLLLPLTQLNKTLDLPDGVEVAAVRQADHGMVEFAIADPAGKLPETCVFDGEKWVEVKPEEKPDAKAV